MKKPEPILLGIETGGTKTIALTATATPLPTLPAYNQPGPFAVGEVEWNAGTVDVTDPISATNTLTLRHFGVTFYPAQTAWPAGRFSEGFCSGAYHKRKRMLGTAFRPSAEISFYSVKGYPTRRCNPPAPRENRLAAVALRRFWTTMSRTFPSWSTARQR